MRANPLVSVAISVGCVMAAFRPVTDAGWISIPI
jgi:hypothetical protein